MRAFHHDPALKRATIEQVQRHLEAGELLTRQRFWEAGKGGPAACAVHSADPLEFERKLGVPQSLVPIVERLFLQTQMLAASAEGKPPDWLESAQTAAAGQFPVKWLEAIQVGADLHLSNTRFMVWMLSAEDHGLFGFVPAPPVRDLVEGVAAAHRAVVLGHQPDKAHWAGLRRRAIVLRDTWPEQTYSADAALASIAETASWPVLEGTGRASEETLEAFLRLGEIIAAAASGWTEEDERQLIAERDELRNRLSAIPMSTDKETVKKLKDEYVAAFQQRMQTHLAALGQRRDVFLAARARQLWRLASAAEQAFLDILRVASRT